MNKETQAQRRERKLEDIRARLGEITSDYVIIARYNDIGGKRFLRMASDEVWAIGALTAFLDELRGIE